MTNVDRDREAFEVAAIAVGLNVGQKDTATGAYAVRETIAAEKLWQSALSYARSAVPAEPVVAPDADLVERCREIIEWQRTGLLNGGKGSGRLHALADSIDDEHYSLKRAEDSTLREAAEFVIRAAAIVSPPAESGEVERLRAAGWSVAVHNDYRLGGERHTFWLWTHPNGRWIKGEGRTDAEALAQCAMAGALGSTPAPPPAAGKAGVAVKPLEWFTPPGCETLRKADSILGVYRVWTHAEATGKWFWSAEQGYIVSEIQGTCESKTEAEAASQADYQRRILSALATPPAQAEPSADPKWIADASTSIAAMLAEWRRGPYPGTELPADLIERRLRRYAPPASQARQAAEEMREAAAVAAGTERGAPITSDRWFVGYTAGRADAADAVRALPLPATSSRPTYQDPSTFDALDTARRQLITLGGDPRGDESGDHIQAAVLNEIDLAIARFEPLSGEG